MFAAIVAFCFFNGIVGEKVPAGGGLGWDGKIYARMVRDLGGMIGGGELSGYHVQRILPAAIVKVAITTLGLHTSDGTIIIFFVIYNVALLLLCCALWCAIADFVGISLAARWVGFLGLFVNFQASKYAFYYPVLTDVSALAAGTLLLFFHVRRRPLPLALTAFAGSFCWPTIGISGALLLLFPIRDVVPARSPPPQRVWQRRMLIGLAAASAVAVLAYVLIRISGRASCEAIRSGFTWAAMRAGGAADASWLTGNGPCNLVKQALTSFPSILGLGLGLLVLLGLVPGGRTPLRDLRAIRPLAVALAALVLLGAFLVQRLLANPDAPNASSLGYLANLVVFPADGQFWMPLVGMVVYWGPVALCAVLAWRSFAAIAQRLGSGAVLVIAATLPFGLVGEGRFLTSAWPFIVLVTVLVIDERGANKSFMAALVVLSVGFSHFWLPLNWGEWTGGDVEGLNRFPKQALLMHFGPWMTWTTYFIQLLLCIAAAMWLNHAWRERERASGARDAGPVS